MRPSGVEVSITSASSWRSFGWTCPRCRLSLILFLLSLSLRRKLPSLSVVLWVRVQPRGLPPAEHLFPDSFCRAWRNTHVSTRCESDHLSGAQAREKLCPSYGTPGRGSWYQRCPNPDGWEEATGPHRMARVPKAPSQSDGDRALVRFWRTWHRVYYRKCERKSGSIGL